MFQILRSVCVGGEWSSFGVPSCFVQTLVPTQLSCLLWNIRFEVEESEIDGLGQTFAIRNVPGDVVQMGVTRTAQ